MTSRTTKKMANETEGSRWYDVNIDGDTNGSQKQIIVQNLGYCSIKN